MELMFCAKCRELVKLSENFERINYLGQYEYSKHATSQEKDGKQHDCPYLGHLKHSKKHTMLKIGNIKYSDLSDRHSLARSLASDGGGEGDGDHGGRRGRDRDHRRRGGHRQRNGDYGQRSCADNVTEDEMEEGGAGEGEHNDKMHRISTSAISSALLESKKGACGLSFCSRSMFHTQGWLHPRVLILVAAVGVRERAWWTPMLREDNMHEFDSVEVCEAERGGSGADEAVGAPEATEEDARNMFLRIVLRVRLCGQEAQWRGQAVCIAVLVSKCSSVLSRRRSAGIFLRALDLLSGIVSRMLPDHEMHVLSAVKPLLGSQNRHPEVAVLAPRVGQLGVEIAIVVGAASTGDIDRGYQREVGQAVCVVLRRGHGGKSSHVCHIGPPL
ncbi:hypothetical protein B0H16DRAFT_1699080 [Mycena metata]|uniref:Uncharacterized protein n=1 Tax=Mycena metata TaxID=1033252 RepID=A0AAD7HLE8_9AGAR|nr:hypothetical protein B0H16DRAFT_1699080 [Mycena metata]